MLFSGHQISQTSEVELVAATKYESLEFKSFAIGILAQAPTDGFRLWAERKPLSKHAIVWGAVHPENRFATSRRENQASFTYSQ
jgi:hypothetical protein